MYDAVFDLDGTLVDSAVQCRAIINAMRSDRGAPGEVSHEQTRRCSSIGGLRMVAILLGECAEDGHADLSEFRARYAAMSTPSDSLFPGAVDALEQLRNCGVRLSVCSAKPHDLCCRVLEQTGISHYFAAALGSLPDRPCKPDPAHLDEVLASIGGRRELCCYIGDSETDHLLALNAEVPLVMVPHGYAAPGIDFAPALIASSFADVPVLVLQALEGDH